MQIYGVPVSPFVQRVLMAARAKGHDIPLNTMPGMALQSPEFKAISPMGRIPVLELEDGTRICESDAITAYLDETLPGPSLMPEDAVMRAQVRSVAAITGLEIAAGARPLMVHLVFRNSDAPEIVTAGRAQLEKGLAALAAMGAGKDGYAVGATFTQADCLLVPVLTLLRLIDPIAASGRAIDAHTAIADYLSRIEEHPVAGRTIGEMRDGFAAMMARVSAQP